MCEISPTFCSKCSQNAVLVGNECKCPIDNGFYLFTDTSNSKASCGKCHRLCGNCFGPSRNECISCTKEVVPFINDMQGTKCNCIDGYFDDSTKTQPAEYCQKCERFCTTCDQTADNCQTCVDNEGVQMVNSKCLCNTPGYFIYLDPLTHKDDCVKCHPLCKSCIGPLPTQCMECFTNKGAIFVASSTCECEKGFYYDSNFHKCEKCDAQCTECYGSTNRECTKCNSEIALSVENHNSWCVSDCDFINSATESYFISGKSCKCIFF